MIRVVSWNVARRRKPLEELQQMDADVALLQEVGPGMAVSMPAGLETGTRRHWDSYTWTAGYPEERFRTWCKRWPMVVKLSDRVDVEWFEQVGPIGISSDNEIAVSDVGLIAAAKITPKDRENGEPFIAVSMYAQIYPTDGALSSAVTIALDLAALVDRGISFSHRILAAGDLNMNYGRGAYRDMQSDELVDDLRDQFGYLYRIYKEKDRFTVVLHRPNGDAFLIRRKVWKTMRGARGWVERDMKTGAEQRRRVTTGQAEVEPGVWNRMKSLGFEFMGPQHPNGRRPDPVPDFLPSDTSNVVTFRRSHQSIEDADQQLDYVFASRGFHESVTTRALNSVEEWGSSDHCRILIDVSAD